MSFDAASSLALADASNPTDVGSQVGFLAQIIIAVGVIPLELIIVTIVLGVHRLVHRRSSRSLQTRVDSAHSAQDSPPYLQPKAELEDEQNRRHDLHGEYLVHEMDDEGEILQIADETDSLDLPLQGIQRILEMSGEHQFSWEIPLQGRNEVMGDGLAQELECSIRGGEGSVGVEDIQELEPPVKARDEPYRVENARDLTVPADGPVRLSQCQYKP